VGINTFKEVVNYFNNNMTSRDKATADLLAAVAKLDKEAAAIAAEEAELGDM
jgi:hypothetical protein